MPGHVDVRGVVQVGTAQIADPFDRETIADLKHYRTLRESYAKVFRRAMLAQVGVADVIFVIYAWAGKHWKIEPGVMEVWLSATVVQVIGVVAIITKGLFHPHRPESKSKP